MDKQKQIEEMASDWCKYRLCGEMACVPKENSAHECHYSMLKAIALNSLGYRKIPDGSVVIPEKITEETSPETLIKIAKYNEKVRKQAVKEVMQKIEALYAYLDNEDEIFIGCLREDLNEIAKELGLEVEE